MKLLTSLLLFLTLAATGALATDQVVFTIVDRVQFSVPGDWPVIASRSTPEKTIFAFQIPNRADEGTPDSTNLSIVSSYLKDAKDRETFDKKAATPEHGAVDRALLDGWGAEVSWRCRIRLSTSIGIVIVLLPTAAFSSGWHGRIYQRTPQAMTSRWKKSSRTF